MDIATDMQPSGSPSEPCKGRRHTFKQAQTLRNRKHRGLTCANCRARKVRCEGGQPSCKTCEAYHDECRYDKAPPMSQVIAMAKRLQEAEEALAQIQARECTSSAEDTSSQPPPSPQPDLLLAESSIGSEVSHGSVPAERITVGSPTMVTAAEPSGFPTLDKSGNVPPATCRGTPKKIVLTELSLDKNGEIGYYGPTSAVHDPPCPESDKVRPSLPAPNDASRAETRSTLAAHLEESSVWEEFGLENASKRTGIPRKIVAELLHLHFTWVSPMFMYVYRPAFIRDMATGGGYYSELLLTVICAHAAKYQSQTYADSLLARARHLLGAAIQQPSSVSTVQALLQLSARELASGLISQAWVYSGIAFRMASDLGLQIVGPSIKGLGPVDREIRLRLFWSCYFWDKATSLYAGRPPAVTEELPDSTLDLLDDSTDLETWNPCYGNTMNLTKLAHGEYPPVNSHAVSCFVNSCKLSIIINDIILQLYSRRGRTITEIALNDIKMRLDLWRTQSPHHLRYNPDELPPIAPPPHIMAQNLLYFATVILAHRPYWFIPKYFSICLAAAQSIERLVLCFEATFGLDKITYLIGYCIYTGASVALEDAKNSNLGAAHPVLSTLLRALNKGMQRCPLLERSLEIIIKGLNHTPPARQAARVVNSEAGGRVAGPGSAGGVTGGGGDQDASAAAATASGDKWVHANPYIPAFPYLDPMTSMNFTLDSYSSASNMHSASVLDCFPEMQMDSNDYLIYM